MSIETFIREIETRKQKEIEGLEKDLQESKSRLQAEMNHTLKEIQERFSTEAKIKSEREQARIIEASKLQAKKIMFDAINANMQSAFAVIQKEIESYTKSPQYKKALETMVSTSKKKLGQNIIVHCREEDNWTLPLKNYYEPMKTKSRASSRRKCNANITIRIIIWQIASNLA